MKTRKLMNFILTVLLSAALFTLPVLADDEPVTLEVPTVLGETDVTVPYVYVIGEKDPGVLMTAAQNQVVSATISREVTTGQGESAPVSGNVPGDIDAIYGGVVIETSGSGKATLKAGGVRGGFGVLAYMDGGNFTGTVDSVTSTGDTGLEVLIGASGSLEFTANTISSAEDGVTVATGIDFNDPENYITDNLTITPPKPDPGTEDWDTITDEAKVIQTAETRKYLTDSPESTDPKGAVEFIADAAGNAPAPIPAEQKSAEETPGNPDITITARNIDADRTAVDISLENGMIDLKSETITSEGTAVRIDLSGENGTVMLTAPDSNTDKQDTATDAEEPVLIIDGEEQGLVIKAPAGSVDVVADGSISGKSAVEVYNDGAEIELDAGHIFGGSGLYIESTSGSAKAEIEKDIAIDNCGINVRTHKFMAEQNFTPDVNAPQNSAAGNASQKDDPKISVTVEGNVTDAFVFPETEGDPIELPDPSEQELIAKAGSYESEGETEIASTGIIVEAETAGSTEITVNGEVYTSYGNEIDAEDKAEVNVKIGTDVTTTYGNRLSADNEAKITFSVGNSINAGGKALDTLASDNAALDISVGTDIVVRDSGTDDEEEIAGIYANSSENGSSKINVKGSIVVLPDSGQTGYGIYSDNTGGKITVSVGGEVIADGKDSIGAAVINDSDSGYNDTESETPEIKTTIEIRGDLSGKSTGLYVDGSGSSQADIFVEGTILGDDAGVEISDELTPENLDLKVWRITSQNGKTVTGAHSKDVGDSIKYLIKFAPNDLEKSVIVVDENGKQLPETHGYPYAKKGQKIYFRPVNRKINAIFDGMTSLRKEADGSFSLVISDGGGEWIASRPMPVAGSEDPVGPAELPNRMDFYPIGDLSWLFDRELPHTGFSASHMNMLPARPQGLSYRNTGLTLQIPSLDIAEEIVTVPQAENSYPVEWLGHSVGLLEGSRLPGAGITVLTGHNHLNTMEAGPFLFLKSLEDGDVLMITKKDGSLLRYKVYGNYRIASDGFASVAGDLREKSLVLITCEDEAPEGGYINRRIVFAEPAR